MTQLWAWEYEGKTEIGSVEGESSDYLDLRIALPKDNGKGTTVYWRSRSAVTNLRKVKVVDEDAVVLEGINDLERRIDRAIESMKPSWFGVFLDIQKKVKEQSKPPVTKTYLTTDQFIKVYKSLSDEKSRELSVAWSVAWSVDWSEAWDAAWDAAWYVAWDEAWDEARNAAWYADLAVLAKDKITTEQFEILTSPWTSCGLSLYAEDWDEVLSPKVTEPTGFAAVVKASNPRSGGEFLWVRIRDYRLEQEDNFVWESENGYREPWGNLFNPIIISEGIEG